MNRILVTGALGQIGSELVTVLRERYGAENVVASDIRMMAAAAAMRDAARLPPERRDPAGTGQPP